MIPRVLRLVAVYRWLVVVVVPPHQRAYAPSLAQPCCICIAKVYFRRLRRRIVVLI